MPEKKYECRTVPDECKGYITQNDQRGENREEAVIYGVRVALRDGVRNGGSIEPGGIQIWRISAFSSDGERTIFGGAGIDGVDSLRGFVGMGGGAGVVVRKWLGVCVIERKL